MGLATACLLLPLLMNPTAAAQEQELDTLLDAIHERMESYREYDSFTASAVTTETRMNGDWQPKRTDVVKKRIVQRDKQRDEEILEALRTEKGKTKDVTDKYEEEREKERKKQAKEREKRRRKQARDGKQEDEDEGGRREMSAEEMFPFSPERRQAYSFERLEDTTLDGRSVLVIETKAIKPSKEFMQGTYRVDAETLDVVELDIKPSKNPRFVQQMNMRMSFELLPEQRFVIRSFWMRLQAGLFFKKIRLQVEESYSDYRISEETETEAASDSAPAEVTAG